MFKTLFTLSLLGISLASNANPGQSPFKKTPDHPLRNQIRMGFIENEVTMRRASNDARPDSMHFSTWTNNSWQLEEVAGLQYDSRGRMTGMRLYDQPGPAGQQFGQVNYQWNANNELLSYVFNLQFAGQTREQFRLNFNYDQFGNKTSATMRMPDSAGNMVTVFGDSLAYRYDQLHQIEEVTFYLFDFVNFTGWIPMQKIQAIEYDRQGAPIEFITEIWDDQAASWMEPLLFTNMQWNFGWNGFDQLFGTITFDTDFSVYERVDFAYNDPTDYVMHTYENGQWVADTRDESVLNASNQVATIRHLYMSQGQWNNAGVSDFQYNNFGIERITEYVFDDNSQQYIPIVATTYGYLSNGAMQSKEMQQFDGTNWQPIEGTEYQYANNSQGLPTSQLVRTFDLSTATFVNSELTEFFYRQPVAASSNDQARSLPMDVWPNPTNGQLSLRLPSMETEAEVRVRNLQGQLLLSQKHQADQGPIQLSLSQLPAGIYLVEAIAGSQHGALRVVKQ